MVWNTGTIGAIINSGFTVTDSGGTGFATTNASHNVIRLADPGSAGLPVAAGSSSVNYFVNSSYSTSSTSTPGSLVEALSGNVSANTATVDTTGLSSGANLALGNNSLTITSGGGITFGGTNPYAITATGAGGLKTGTSGGSTTLNNNNTNSVTISAPILGNGANSLTVNGVSTSTTVLGGLSTYAGATNLNGGTIRLAVAQNGATSGPLGTGAGALSMALGGTSLDLAGNNVTVGAFATTGSGENAILSDSGAASVITMGNANLTGLTVTGPTTVNVTGSLTLPGAAVFSGATGALQISSAVGRQNNIGAALGNAALILNGVSNFQNTSTQAIAGNLVINGTNNWSYQADVSVSGSLTGNGTLAANIGFTFRNFNLNGDATNFQGTLNWNATGGGDGTLLNLGNTTNVGAGLATINLSGNSGNRTFLQYTGVAAAGSKTVPIGELDGTAFTFVQNTAAGTTATFQIGGKNTNSNYSGTVQDNSTALAAISKVGNGILSLAGANLYSGGTIITAGILRAANSSALGTGTVAVNSSATLALGADSSTTGALTTGAETWSGNGTYAWKLASAGSPAAARSGGSGASRVRLGGRRHELG